MKPVDQLLYEKSNQYRIHADNLRWILLGGYAAFFGATIQHVTSKPFGFLMFLLSIFYILVLCVQNWYYNLFSKYVKHCEVNLKAGVNLLTVEEFNKEVIDDVNPFHESFFFAYVCVLLASSMYLVKGFCLNLFLSILIVLILLLILFILIKYWNKLGYKFVIKNLSDLMNKQ